MNSIAVDIKDMLVAEAGFVFKTNLFIAKQPTKINNCITVIDTSSTPIQTTLDSVNYYNDSVQILVRHENYLDAFQLAETIVNTLHGKANELWNDTYYLYIGLVSGPAQMSDPRESNSKQLNILSINFNIKRHSDIQINNNSSII